MPSSRISRFLFRAAPILLLPFAAACSGDGALPTELSPHISFSKGGKGGGGGSETRLIEYVLTGDATTITAVVIAKSGEPFEKLELNGMALSLGVPTGDIDVCRTGSGSYTNTFGAYAGSQLTGTLKINMVGRKLGLMNFLGVDEDGATVQFSVEVPDGSPTVVETQTGTSELRYLNSRLYFGGNSAHADGLYRCVNMILVATQQT
jgi:hypothetical protein